MTDKDQMKAWYFEIPEFVPEVGFDFQFYGGSEEKRYLHLCKIIEVIVEKKLSYSWKFEGYPGDSVVTFELFPEGDKTRLKLTHEGLETFPADDPAFAKENFAGGWTTILGDSLRNFVETEPFARSVTIRAGLESVWDLILHPNGLWGNAFGDGAMVDGAIVRDTSWEVGAPVVWTDTQGNIGANGVVTANRQQALLEVSFYDDIEPAPDAALGEYTERFRLEQNEVGDTVLTAEIEGLPRMYIPMHTEMWEKALQIIKKEAES